MDASRRLLCAVALLAGLLSGASCFLDLSNLSGGPPGSPDAGPDGGGGGGGTGGGSGGAAASSSASSGSGGGTMPGVCVKGECGGGPCVVASGANALGAHGLALGGGYLFWTNQQGNSVKRLDLATGKLFDYVPSSQSPSVIAANKTHVVWVDMAAVWQCALDATDCAASAAPLAQPGGSGSFQVSGIAVDDTYAFWSYDAASDTDGQILRCNIVNGCSSKPNVMAITQTHPHGIAVDSASKGFVYWAHHGSGPQFGEVRSLHKDLSDNQMYARIAVNRDFVESVAIGATDVYWTEAAGGIFHCPADQVSCTAKRVADPMGQPMSEQIVSPIDLALDASRVYWANNGATTVMACSLPECAGHPTVIAQGQQSPRAVVVGPSCVYWADATGGGRVLRIAK